MRVAVASALAMALGALAIPSGAGAQVAPSEIIAPVAPVSTALQISTRGELSRAPDLATFTAGVVTSAPAAVEAMRLNAERMQQVVAALRRAGIEQKDLQTASIQLQPQYDYQEQRAPRLIGYEARNEVRVRLRELGRMGQILDALVKAGATNIQGPQFELVNPEQARDEARRRAIRTAFERANLYAEATGLKVKRIVSISEGLQEQPPVPMARMAMESQQADVVTPVAPGEVQVVAEVNLVFELEPAR